MAVKPLLVLLFAMSLANVARAQWDPSQVQPFFIIRPAFQQEYTQVYSDAGGGAPMDLTVWNITNTETPKVPFMPFGTYSCNIPSRTLTDCLGQQQAYFGLPGVNVSSAGGQPVGILANSYAQLWNDQNSRASDDGAYWIPQSTYQYNPVGYYFTGGTSSSVYTNPPPGYSSWLVANFANCLVSCPSSPTLIWKNQGDGRSDADLSMYSVGNQQPGSGVTGNTPLALGTNMGQTNFNSPMSMSCLAAQCTSFIQLNVAKVINAEVDWTAATNIKTTSVTAGTATYKNTLKTKQSETFESSTSVTCSNTLSLEQSMGFSKTISYEESIQIKTGIPDVFQVKTGATFDQEYSYSNEFDTAQSVTDTVEEDFAVKQNIDVPPETTVRADWMLAQAGGVQVPVTLTVQYQAVDWSNSGKVVTSQNTVQNYLTKTGFTGTFGQWIAANSTLTTTVKATMTVNSVYNSTITLTCVPTTQTGCPANTTVNNIIIPGQPAATSAAGEAAQVKPGTMVYTVPYYKMKQMKPIGIRRRHISITQTCFPNWRSTRRVPTGLRRRICGF